MSAPFEFNLFYPGEDQAKVESRPLDTFEFLVQRVCPQLRAFPDVESKVLPALQTFFNSPDRIFDDQNPLQCTCYSADSDGDDPRWCPAPPCPATKQSSEILETILPDLRCVVSPSESFSAMLKDTEDRAKTLTDKYALQNQARQRTTAWVGHMDEDVPEMGIDMPASQQSASSGSIRSLPLEVLSAVFIQAQLDNPMAMFLLSHVDNAFRDASITTPRLWASINILHSQKFTQLQLHRSKVAPLNVSMSLPPILTGDDGTLRLTNLISILTPHHHRIQNLEAIQPYKKWVRMALKLVTTADLPQLKTLDVGLARTIFPDSYGGGLEPPEHEPERQSAKALNMTTISMRHVLVKSQSAFLSPSVTNLKVKFAVFTSFSGMVTALQAMPNLQSLHLEDLRFLQSDWSLQEQKIDLPDLHELLLVRMGLTSESYWLLDICLQTPALRSLTLTHWEQELSYMRDYKDIRDDEDAEWSLYSILQRTPQLRRLELIHVNLSRNTWRNAMHYVSATVTDIRLSYCSFPRDSFLWIFGPLPADGHGCCCCLERHNIIDEHAGQAPFRNLRRLTIESEEYITSEGIRETLVARSENGGAARLESLTITGWLASNVGLDDLSVIREHVDVLKTVVLVDQDVAFLSEDESDVEGSGSDGEESESSAQFSDSSNDTGSDASAGDDGAEAVVNGGLADEEPNTGTRFDQLEETSSATSEDGSYLGSDEEEGSSRNSIRPSSSIVLRENPLSIDLVAVVGEHGGMDAVLNTSLPEVGDDEAHSGGTEGGSGEDDEKSDDGDGPADWDGSVYSDSCSESWASGDEVIAQGRLPYEVDA